MDIKQITQDIAPDWERSQKLLRESLNSSCDLLNKINNYLLENMGKQLRPMLGILSAGMVGKVTEKSIVTSVVAEIIHNATLLHDDVADNSDKRRGRDTVHKLFSPAASVLTGDYWLSKALSLVAAQNDNRMLAYYIKAVEALSEGELEQMDRAINMDTTEADYYKIINGKTASLFVAVIASAGYTAGASEEELKKLEEYAWHLGMAFQIRDDIFDYTPRFETGKPSGSDIREKKITLPLIKAFDKSPAIEKAEIISLLKNAPDVDDALVLKVMEFVKKYHGIGISQDTLNEHCRKAVDSLSVFGDSVYKKHLSELAEYVGTREV